VRLVAARPTTGDPHRVAELLAAGATAWLPGSDELPEVDGLRRYAVDLRLPLGGEGGRLLTFSKAAYLDIGMPRRTSAGWEVEIAWRAARGAPLFPVFSGWLTLDAVELRLEGLYAPPGGVVGRVADRMLLHLAANGTARWLLGELDRAASEEGS
jgi:hypothetical protein